MHLIFASMSETRSSLRKAFRTIIRPRIHLVFTGLGLIVISKGASFVAPLAMKTFVDELIPNQDLEGIKTLVIVVLIALVLQATTSFLLTRLVSVAAQYLITELRIQVQQKLLSLPVRFFENTQTGALVSRVMKDVEGVKSLVGTGLVQLIGGLFTAAVAFIFLIRLSLPMTLFSLTPLALFALIAFKAFTTVRPIFRERGKIEAEVKGRLNETFSGIRMIKGFSAESREKSRFEKGATTLFENIKKSMIYMALISSGSILLAGVATTLVTGLGGYYIIEGSLSLGEFLQFTFLLGLLISPIFQLTSVGTEITDALAGLDRTEELFEKISEFEKHKGAELIRGFRSLAFDQVCFSYNEGRKVLNNISFELKAGQTIALVGSSGAGKSTLANLAARFLEPDSGQLIINGQYANEIDLASYRKQLGVVLQDDFLFDGTIRENVLYGNPECSEEELNSALDAAYVSEFVTGLEEGIETVIGERGIKLSGGQRQRLAIARALVANPRLLILDEATSNLDAESEHYIQLGLENLTRNRATLVIAHRLSTIQNADTIIVLEKGEIVEKGTHKELFEKQGRYYSLYTRQARI